MMSTIVRTYTLAAVCALTASACMVPQRRYDAALANIEAVQAAHRHTAAELQAAKMELSQVRTQLDKGRAEVDSREQQLAASELETQQTAAERDDAARMVDQLRDELARAGDHLHTFSAQKGQLEQALEESRSRAAEVAALGNDAELRARIMKEIVTSLVRHVDEGSLVVDASGGRTVVRMPASLVFDEDGSALTPKGSEIVGALARAIGPLEKSRLIVTERPKASDAPSDDGALRLQLVSDALAAGGVAFERVTVSLPPEAPAEPAATAEEAPAAKSTRKAPAKKAAPAKEPDQDWRTGPGSIEIAVDVGAANETG